jgi:hypothetical protein
MDAATSLLVGGARSRWSRLRQVVELSLLVGTRWWRGVVVPGLRRLVESRLASASRVVARSHGDAESSPVGRDVQVQGGRRGAAEADWTWCRVGSGGWRLKVNRAKQAPDNDFGEEAPAQACQATPPGPKAGVAEASGEEVVVRKPVLRNREVTRSVELAESRWVNIKPQGRDGSGDRMERCRDDGGAVALVARRSQSPNARLVASRLVAAPLWSLARALPSALGCRGPTSCTSNPAVNDAEPKPGSRAAPRSPNTSPASSRGHQPGIDLQVRRGKCASPFR